MTTDEIQQERKKPRKVADILRQYMYCTNNTCLNKPLLAKEPVDGVVREIYSGKERQETRFEKEIKMIMDIILQDIG